MSEGFRLSPQQRRLLAARRAGEERAFGAVLRLSVRGELDSARLGEALEQVVDRWEILRTVFRFPEGAAPEQVVREQARGAFSLREMDLSDLGPDERAARLGELTRAARETEHDLERGPLLAVTLVELEEQRCAVILAAPALCADVRSLDRLAVELAGELAGAEPFDPDPLQYVDVAEWQNELLEGEDSLAGRRHWRERAGAPGSSGADLELPFQTPAPGPLEPALFGGELDPDVLRSVRAAAERLGVSERAFLLAAWAVLLRRLARRPDVLVGAAGDGRRYEELEGTLGPLARHAPVPLWIETTAPFRDVALRVAEELAALDRWLECHEPPSEGGAAPPAFGFAWHAAPPALAGGLRIEERLARLDRFACRLVCESGAERLTLRLDADRGAFGGTTIRMLADRLPVLLADAAARPDEEIAALDVLGAVERDFLVREVNDSDAGYPLDVCAHHFVEQQADRTPDAVAVRQGEAVLTYGELEERANRLAHHLGELGVGPDTLVALCIERSFDMVIGILGILKAGGAYVPVDPAYPEDRILFLIEDTRAPVIVTQASVAASLPESEARVVRLDADREEIERRPATRPDSGVRPDNLVYVIYTSGSTGKPKGVVITHEKLVISNTARVKAFGHVPESFLLLSSVAFDSSVVGLFWSLCGGGTLELIPEGQEKDLPRIPEAIEAHAITHLLTLPSFYRLILETAEPAQLRSLRTVIVAGEACPLKMVEHHREVLPGVGLFSEYGATETTVFSSVYDCLAQTRPIASLGTPIDNARMYVLDERLQPCPFGVPGEVHFGGIAIALGYWRRPELTAERYVPDPFDRRPGARLYKSGDLSRFLENGEMEFLGRIDNQVKIRGYRIELEEIEVALLKHPAVKESAVLALADLSDEKRLVGYVVGENGAPPTVHELREFLQETLPDFMVPAAFVFLPDFPRTPNGKVDRKALPEPGTERPELESTFAAPRTPVEERLAAIWADVLGLGEVGVNDNFFELGGDSILSIQIVSRAKRAGLKLTPRQLFENQTVAELAAVAEEAGGEALVADSEQGAVTGDVPLTPVQRWFFELELAEPEHWNMPLLVDVRRRVPGGLLVKAFAALLEHHDALRLRFTREEGRWRQTLAAPDRATPVVFEDLSGVPPAEQGAELDRRAAAHQASLDLAAGPLTRLVLFERGPDRPQALLWIVHHLAIDGVSWRILLEDLEAALERLERGETIELPPKTTSFRRWAQRLVERAAGPEAGEEARAWPAAVGACDAEGRVPLDHDGANVEASVRKVRVSLDEEATRRLLSEVPKTYNTQINDVLLTAFVHAAAEWTGAGAVRLNLEGHGREEEQVGAGTVDLSRTVGWFTTDYPVLLRDTAPFEPGAALRSIKEQLRAIPSQGFGFGLARYLSPDAATVAALRALPQPALGFNYLGQFDQVFGADARFRLSEAPSGPATAPGGERVFVLEAYGMVTGGRLELDFEYSANLHERATIERLGERFLATLRELIEHCLSPEAGGFTRSDFADFDWDDADLSSITEAIQKSQGG